MPTAEIWLRTPRYQITRKQIIKYSTNMKQWHRKISSSSSIRHLDATDMVSLWPSTHRLRLQQNKEPDGLRLSKLKLATEVKRNRHTKLSTALGWCVWVCVCVLGGGRPRIPTCSHTICHGTIPLLSPLLGPFRCGRISGPQPAQLPLRGPPSRFLIFQGARLSGSPTTTMAIVLALPHPPGVFVVYPLTPASPSVSITPPLPSPLRLSFPLATVTAFSQDAAAAAAHLAVRSARPRQSCQFTCLECRILPPCPPELAAITISA